MKKALVAAAALALASVTTAHAADGLGGKFSANVGFVSEYFFRGISQTDDKPAIQGGFDFAHDSGVYVGVWGSNVDFNDGDQASIETDFYAGITGEVNKITWDVGVIYYAYPGAASSLDYDFWEVKGALGYDFGVAAVKGSIFYSPNYFADTGDAVYYSGDVTIPVGKMFTVGLHVGHQTIDDNAKFALPDYTDYGASITTSLAGFDVSLSYTDTDLSKSECPDACRGTVWLGIKRAF